MTNKSTSSAQDSGKGRILVLCALIALALGLSLYGRVQIHSDDSQPSHSHNTAPSSVANASTDGSMGGDSDSHLAAMEAYFSPVVFEEGASFDASLIPPCEGRAYAIIHDNVPFFSETDLTLGDFVSFSAFDALGRSGAAFAMLGPDTITDAPRDPIGDIRPTGWHTVKYPHLIEDNYLYNRCHLIGHQLLGRSDAENLITGTRYLNVSGMLPFENRVADYIRYANCHMLYRVTPVFTGEDLLARGVLMEACSMEDHGQGLHFNVFIYNVQPGILIDYADGENSEDPDYDPSAVDFSSAPFLSYFIAPKEDTTFVLNTSSKKYHRPDCKLVPEISLRHRIDSTKKASDLGAEGYMQCNYCAHH